MDIMLSGLDFPVAYLDHILIKSTTREQHVKEVFLKKKNEFVFKLRIEKSEFFSPKINIWDGS